MPEAFMCVIYLYVRIHCCCSRF